MEKFEIIFLFFILSSLFYLSWQDIKEQQISRNLTLITVISALVFSILKIFFFDFEKGYDSLLGALILGFVFLLCVVLTKEKSMGMGDVYLFILMGLLVGFEKVFFALSILVFTALLFSVVKYRGLNLKQKIPLVPFITLSIFFVLLFDYFLG